MSLIPSALLLIAIVVAQAQTAQAQELPISSRGSASRAGSGFTMEEILSIQSFFRGSGNKNRQYLAAMDRSIPKSSKEVIKVGAVLPNDLKRRVLALPGSLEQALPTTAAGTRRMALGSRVLLLDNGDRILDMIEIPPEDSKGLDRIEEISPQIPGNSGRGSSV